MDDNAVCFTVQASVDPSNCWFLIVGVLLNSFVVSIGLHIAQAAVKERSNEMRSHEATTVMDDRGKALTAKLFKIPFVRFIVYGSSAIQQHNDEDREENEAVSAEASEEDPEWRHWF
jgi:hypothetical protein